jgi:hypothetical protein
VSFLRRSLHSELHLRSCDSTKSIHARMCITSYHGQETIKLVLWMCGPEQSRKSMLSCMEEEKDLCVYYAHIWCFEDVSIEIAYKGGAGCTYEVRTSYAVLVLPPAAVRYLIHLVTS